MRFSANLGFLWPDRPLVARIEAAARAGFSAVEFHWPYDEPPAALRAALRATGLAAIALNTRPGDRTRGELGLLALPDRAVEAIAHVVEALDTAQEIGCGAVHLLLGRVPPEARAQASPHLREMIDIALGEAARRKLSLLIEPMNAVTAPGYMIPDFPQAEALLDAVGVAPVSLALMLDSFHAEMSGYDPARIFDAYRPWIGHVQFSDAPERAAPYEGGGAERFLRHLIASGWERFAGAEYVPAGRTEDSLGWMERLGAPQRRRTA
jgi:hydroxypyruvate isomerase